MPDYDGVNAFDYPCSATFRHYYAEEYEGKPRIDYEPQDTSPFNGEDTPLSARVAALERDRNTLYALAAMRQVELTELAQRRHKPRY